MSAALSQRQLDVLACMVAGLNGPQTARALGIGPETVRTHQRFIYARLGVVSGLEAVAVAVERGLVAEVSR
jgi:DNA-binding CsgD family transcriptional regulator